MTTPVEDILKIDAQIKLLENLLKLNDLLAKIRDGIDDVSDLKIWVEDPGTGEMLGKLKNLLFALQSDMLSIPKIVTGLDAGLTAAGEITAGIDAITRWIRVLDTVETSSAEQKVKDLGELFGDWTTLLGAIGYILEGFSVNPLIGIYFMLIGKCIASIATSIGKIEEAVAIRNQAILFAKGLDPEIDTDTEEEDDKQRTALLAAIEELRTKRDALIAEAGKENYEDVAAALLACATALGLTVEQIDALKLALRDARERLRLAWDAVQKLRAKIGALRISGASEGEIRGVEEQLQSAGEELRAAYDEYNARMREFYKISEWLRRYFAGQRQKGETRVEDWWLDDHYPWISDRGAYGFPDLSGVKQYLQSAGLLRASRFANLVRMGLAGVMGVFPPGGCWIVALLTALIGTSSVVLITIYAAFTLGWFGLGGTVGIEPDVPLDQVVDEVDSAEVVPSSEEVLEPTPEPFWGMTIDEFGDMMGMTDEQKAQLAIAFMLDPTGDWIWSMMAQAAGMHSMMGDINGFFGVPGFAPQMYLDTKFNFTDYPCNEQILDVMTVCAESYGPMVEGEMLIFGMELAGEVPLNDPAQYLVYSVVLDTDGDPANNYQPVPPWDWDYYQNTDLWYELNWNPNFGLWWLTATDVRGGGSREIVDTSARVVIKGNLILFFIPANEVEVARPGYRMTAFVHDGSYAVDTSGGDVTGDDPTQPLNMMPEDVIVLPAE